MKILSFKTEKTHEVIEIENTCNSIQTYVGGYFEYIHLDNEKNLVLICNEEGSLIPLPVNALLLRGLRNGCPTSIDVIHGDFFICQTDGEELCSIQEENLELALSFVRRL